MSSHVVYGSISRIHRVKIAITHCLNRPVRLSQDPSITILLQESPIMTSFRAVLRAVKEFVRREPVGQVADFHSSKILACCKAHEGRSTTPIAAFELRHNCRRTQPHLTDWMWWKEFLGLRYSGESRQ